MISPPSLPRDESGEVFDLESASARGSREGSVLSGITVTTVGGKTTIKKIGVSKELHLGVPWNKVKLARD